MKKVKHILTIFLHSLIPQDIYYPKLLHTRLSFSFKYYLAIICSLSIIFTLVVLIIFSPLRLIGYKNSVINSLSSFPNDTRVSIKNGVIESNQNKPLFLWVYHNSQPLFVFMVHTKDMLTKTHIPLPLVFFGPDRLQLSYKGTTVLREYNMAWNVVITKQTLQPVISSINSLFPPLMLIFYLMLIAFVPLSFIAFSTIFILASSVLVYFLLKSFIPHIHIKKCIQASMHGTHIPLIISLFLFTLFPLTTNIIPITISLIFVFTLISTYEMYSKELSHLKGR